VREADNLTTLLAGSSKQAGHTPDAVCKVFELLMMGRENA